jgi:hypothetical protein
MADLFDMVTTRSVTAQVRKGPTVQAQCEKPPNPG